MASGKEGVRAQAGVPLLLGSKGRVVMQGTGRDVGSLKQLSRLPSIS